MTICLFALRITSEQGDSEVHHPSIPLFMSHPPGNEHPTALVRSELLITGLIS